MQRRQFAHLAGADHGHGPAAQIAEDLFRQRRCGVADRDGAGTEAGFRAHALADGERRVKQAVQQRADRLRVRRGGVRVLHLPENLRFTDDERVEPAGHAEEMTRGVEAVDVVDVRREIRCLHPVELGEEGDEIGARRRRVVAGDVQLGAIAGRDDDRFAGGSALGDGAKRLGDASHLEIHTLPQIDGRRPMTDSDEQQIHRS